MADFEAIVIGTGCAGSVAAYELAKAGKKTLLVTRGDSPGSKDMTGGRIYTHSLRNVFPLCEKEAPFERRITHERLSLMAPDSDLMIDFTGKQMFVPGSDSFSVLRAKFDPWLTSKATDAGAELMLNAPVTELTKDENGKVWGITANDKTISADVVVLADGVNSLLSEQAVGYKKPPINGLAIGIKEVFALPASVISDRCGVLNDDEGTAWLFVGDATKGVFGGGFMYANKESISLGLVVGLEALTQKASAPIYQLLDDFKKHMGVASIIKGGTLVEHSGHLIAEGGLDIMPPLTGDGVLLAGDTAMMCVNLGYLVRGMDFAIASGMYAGRAAAQALDAGDTSKEGLACYETMLNDSFVMQDLKHYKNAPDFLQNFNRMFTAYPEGIGKMMTDMFIVDNQPSIPLRKVMMPLVKSVGLFNILADVRGAMKTL